MNFQLSTLEEAFIETTARTRGLRAITALNYERLKPAGNAEALRKVGERLCLKEFCAGSKLSSGPQIFYLASKGVTETGAPAAWARRPTSGILAQMLGLSSLAWRTNEFRVLTNAESENFFRELDAEADPPSYTGRFLLRRMKPSGSEDFEWHLHAFLCEVRSADKLVRRANTIIDKLRQSALVSALIDARLFGLTIAVPSAGVKATLRTKTFPVEASIVVVESLRDLRR